jgi:tetratricopeptide (TPR) repeat protein
MSQVDLQDILDRAKGSVRVGDHEEAERLLKSYIAKKSDSREAHLLLGATFAKSGKLAEAVDEFTTLLAKNPQDIEALNNIAVVYRRQGKLQDALGAMLEAIDLDPTRAEFYYNIGNIQKQLLNLKAASMSYAKVIELDPSYAPAYNNLGTIYEELKEYNKAYSVFHKGLSLDRNNPALHFNYGVALEANGRLEDAANEYRAALRSKPGWLEPMNNLGIIFFKQGHHDKAIDTFNRILDSDPFNAEARNNIAVVQSDQGRIKEAIQNYRRAIEADPKYTKAVVNLERILEDSGDFADAVIELEKLVKLTPSSAEVRDNLAGLYLKMERYPEALEQANAVLEWDPADIRALRVKGAVERITGSDKDAQQTFEKILSIDPNNYGFQLDLADIHFHRKEYKEAEQCVMAYLVRRPNDREAKLLLGKLYAEMGNRTHAIQIFEELSRADPGDNEALAALAELHKEAGSLEKAVRAADTLVNLQGKRGTSCDLSELNKSLEFYENAVTAYSSSVKEMWDRNMKILGGGMEEAAGDKDADMSLLLGASVINSGINEEDEALFIEDSEFFDEEEPEDGIFFAGENPADLPEEDDAWPRERSVTPSLDDLAESSPGPGNFASPQSTSDAPLSAAEPEAAPQIPAVPQPAMPQSVAPQSAAPQAPAVPQPAAPQSVAPQSAAAQAPAAPQPATPQGTAPQSAVMPPEPEAAPRLTETEIGPEIESGMEFDEKESSLSGESVEDIHKEPPDREIDANDILDLLRNLKALSISLPEEERENFLKSDYRLKLESIIDVLEGHKDLPKVETVLSELSV